MHGDSLSGHALGETRTLSLYNIHTKEDITVTFKRDGKYDDAALKQLNHFMRDWRADKEINMDPALIDLIWTLHKQLGSNVPVNLICGLRTAETNESLRRKGGGQAKRSHRAGDRWNNIFFETSEEARRMHEGHERARQHDPALGGFAMLEKCGPDGLVADEAARRHYFGEDLV